MLVSLDQTKTKGSEENRMAQTKRRAAGKGPEELSRTVDLLSTMLAREVRELNTRQKAARCGDGDAGTVRSIKEVTAVLKDLVAATKLLNEQGADATGAECGVVLLPTVEDG